LNPARPSLRAFGALWFCYYATIGTFNPFAPLWFKDLGFSALAIGSIASLQAWTRVVAPYAWGWLGDHSGQRVRLLRVAAAVCVVAALALWGARSDAWVAACTALLFLANGGVVPLSEASLARHLQTADGVDSTRYGRVRVWGSMGFIAAVLVCGVLLQSAGIGFFPLIVVVGYTLLLVAAFRLPGAADPRDEHTRAPAIWSVLKQPAVAWFYAAIFFTVLAHTSLYTFFSLYLDGLGYGKSTVGFLWAVSVVVEIAFFWWQGRVFDRLKPHVWLQWAAAASVIRFAATAAFGTSLAVLVLAQSLHVLTFAAQHAACIVLITRHFPGALRGRGQALYTVLGYGSSGVIGGVIGGWLSSRFGYASVFWAASAIALVGWWCAARAGRMLALHASPSPSPTPTPTPTQRR
jgi:MFS transporter, PPP family, 3-phenylpropionic acid transporter